MRVAVVGGSGFVGGHVLDALTKAGHDAYAVDLMAPQWHPSAMFRWGSIMEESAMISALDGAQVVMHLAAMSNTQSAIRDPVMAAQLNCVGTTNVLSAAHKVGAERVLVAGSTLVSGVQQPMEMNWPNDHYETVEDEHGREVRALMPQYDDMVVDEESPFAGDHDAHPYVATKIFTEMIARSFATSHDLPVTVFRYGIMYGPRMTPGVVVHTFIERAMAGKPLMIQGDGQQWRQYMHVKDMADAHVAMIDQWDASENETFIIAPEYKVTIADIAAEVSTHFKGTEIDYAPARPGDIPVRLCIAGRARSHLGWSPKFSLEEGIADTVDWYRRHAASGMRRK